MVLKGNMAMKIKRLVTLAAICMAPVVSGADIDTGNGEAANADVKNKRSCYTCCNDQNGNSVDAANSQESCDGVWAQTAPDWMPEEFLADLFASRDDWRAQLDILSDDRLWDRFVVGDGEDEPVPMFVVEVVDWMFANAADVTVARMAIVQLAWLKTDFGLTPAGDELVETVLLDALSSEDFRVRRAALHGAQETKAFLSNPTLLVEMVRVTAEDPDQSVRDTGFRILADR